MTGLMDCIMTSAQKNTNRAKLIARKSGKCAAVWDFLSDTMKMKEMIS